MELFFKKVYELILNKVQKFFCIYIKIGRIWRRQSMVPGQWLSLSAVNRHLSAMLSKIKQAILYSMSFDQILPTLHWAQMRGADISAPLNIVPVEGSSNSLREFQRQVMVLLYNGAFLCVQEFSENFILCPLPGFYGIFQIGEIPQVVDLSLEFDPCPVFATLAVVVNAPDTA